jgi:hypothetical protein
MRGLLSSPHRSSGLKGLLAGLFLHVPSVAERLLAQQACWNNEKHGRELARANDVYPR